MKIFQRGLLIHIEKVKSSNEVTPHYLKLSTILHDWNNYSKLPAVNSDEVWGHITESAKQLSVGSIFTVLWDVSPSIDFTIAFARTLSQLASGSFGGVLSELIISFLDKQQKDNLQSLYRSQFKLIQAAGGLVFNDKSEILLIYRKEKWDLPKGKIELHEQTNECAIREVSEETGISGLQIVEKLATTYHEYSIANKMILKKTEWFLMKSNFNGSFEPQLIEDITKVEWRKLSIKEAEELDTYDLIKSVLKKGLKRMH